VVNVDLSITLGTIIELSAFIVGGIVTLAVLKNMVTALKEEMSASKRETKEQIAAIQVEIKKMGEILIDMARFEEKLLNLDKRVTTHGRKLDDLSRGDGFVRGHRSSVDGEYQ